ncbi:SMR family transporter [Bacteroides sp. An51A]|uniref:DMT family transporter n=1 Tax=Bacteroides sp. An51A TaxID=1965640 RepID=UPI000B39CA54|nr:SMR family transporter [Bacteroides sp. An51A]OUN79712.1 QacE family quaternary ammonium compound efflux SMR transporter [Bacteroides sp. An51A]
MDWITLIVAGLFETAFAFSLGKMKGKKGKAYHLWITGFIGCLIISMWLLALAVQTLPIGTAYPVWTGIGAVGTVLLGIVCFHERASFARIFFMATLIGSIIGLKMV